MKFRVLGPVEAWVGRCRVRLGAPRNRRAFAALVLDANRVVAVERLVDAIWEDSPPATAREQVRVCVSALRRVLRAAGAGRDVVATHPSGYLLRADEDQLDELVFADRVGRAGGLAEAGRVGDASVELRRALALWRGRPFADVDGRVFEARRAYLEEQRLLAAEQCIELELELGRNAELVGELSTLVAEYPFRERLRGLLMLTLYRAGRQVEALEQYQVARELLRDDLGLEPNEELRRLEQRILNQDPGLDIGGSRSLEAATAVPPPSVPRQLPADVADFTGRGRQVTQIRELLGAAGSDAGATVISVVTGKAGVGKTALAVHAAHGLTDRFPDGQLYMNLRGTGPHAVDPTEVLGGFLRALGVDSSAVPDGREERAGMYRSLLADRRVLVLLDDAAEFQVGPLLPGGAGCGVLVTSRTPLTGLAGGWIVEVDVLDPDQAVRLLARVAGAARVRTEPEAAQQLARLCGGLPLAVRIVGARLAARPRWRLADLVSRLADERRRLDELAYGELEVRASLALTYQGLDPDTRSLFRRLGLLTTPDFAAWVAAPLLDATASNADDRFEQLVDARLIDPLGKDAAEQNRYRFHDLARLYARERAHEEETEGDRTAALARVFGCLLALTEDAHRWAYGGDDTLIHGDAPRWRPTPEVADRLRADAMTWLSSERHAIIAAVHQARDLKLDELCWDLAITAVVLFQPYRYLDDWRDTAEQALTATWGAENRRGHAATLYSLGERWLELQRYGEAEELLTAALARFDRLGERHGYALTLRYVASVDYMRGRWDAALSRYAAARTILHEVGDPLAEAYVLGIMGTTVLDCGHPTRAQRLLRQALALCRGVGRRRIEVQVTHRLGECLTWQGDLEGAERAFETVLAMSRDTGDHVGESYALLGLAEIHIQRGRHAPASANLSAAVDHARLASARLPEACVFLVFGRLALAGGQRDAAVRQASHALRIFEELRVPRWQARALDTLATAHEAMGDPAAARRTAAEARDRLAQIHAPKTAELTAILDDLGV